MHPRIDPPAKLLALAAAQSGVVSAGQAESCGLGRHSRQRLVDTGQWRRFASVYVVHPLGLDWLGSAWAGVLIGGPESRLGGEAAGFLHGLIPDAPASVEVLVPRTARARTRPPLAFVREQAGVRSPRSPGEPPRTTLEDTVLDLCDGAELEVMVALLTRAVGSRRTSTSRLATRLAGRSRIGGRALLTELLGDVGTGVHSPLELRYLREVETPHGLPRASRQHRSRARHVRDVVYEDFGVVVELDGRLGHEGIGRFRDMGRDNLAAVVGEVTLRYGYADVAEFPCLVARQVAAVLTARGWRGVFRCCPSCAALSSV